MSNDITEVIDILRRSDFYGAGDCVEVAKGKREIVASWSGLKRTVKRTIKAKK